MPFDQLSWTIEFYNECKDLQLILNSKHIETSVFINFIMASKNSASNSQTQSFRLQRLTKTMGTRDHSISEYEPKETLKLAALNSIGRSVKYNDLSYISGRDMNKLRKEPDVSNDDITYESAHVNLASMRKNYDSMHKDKTHRDVSISKLKVIVKKCRNKKTNYRSLKENCSITKTKGGKKLQIWQTD